MLELLGEDAATPSGSLFRPKVTPPAGSGNLELLCVRGVELALRDPVVVEREIELLDGAYSTVQIRVAGLAPFVTLKATAYLDRRLAKDVYDLLFVLRNWPGGPGEAARVIANSPIATEELLHDSLGRLAGDFISANHAGPRDYEGFVAPGPRSSEAAALRDEDAEAGIRAAKAAGMLAAAIGDAVRSSEADYRLQGICDLLEIALAY